MKTRDDEELGFVVSEVTDDGLAGQFGFVRYDDIHRQPGTDVIPGVTLDDDGRILTYDIEIQTRSTFESIRRILEDAGSSCERPVDLTVYPTDMKADFTTYNRVWAEYFAENPPSRTRVKVGALPTPIATELKCIATITALGHYCAAPRG